MGLVEGRRSWKARSAAALTGLAAAAIVVAMIGVLALGRFASSGSGGPPAGSAAPSSGEPSAPVALASSSSTPGATSSASGCDNTKPVPALTPPNPFLASPPPSYEGAWYGTAHLWTLLERDGETWGPWLFANEPLPQKTFWWSADWVPRAELEPAITVTGRRLDRSGSFSYGNPGTNATADFGTAMLVGIDVPSIGCWEVTARYRDATLSYVVQVVD